MKAVIWTDVFQMTTIFIGMLCALIQGLRKIGSFEKVWQTGLDNDRVNIEYVTLIHVMNLYKFNQ